MRSKTVRSSRVLPPKNSQQSPLVILGNKKKSAATGAKANAATHKTKAQPKLGRSRAPSGEKPLAKAKQALLKKKPEDKSKPSATMEPPAAAAPLVKTAKPKVVKVALKPAAPKKQRPRKTSPAARKEKATAKKLAAAPLRKVKAPKATPAVRAPKKQQDKTNAAVVKKDEPPSLLLKDGMVRKRAPYKKRVKVEPVNMELTDSAIAKILSKAKEPRGTKEKKSTPQDAQSAKKQPKAKVAKEKAPAKPKEDKKTKSTSKVQPLVAVVKETKKEPAEVKLKVEPVPKEVKKPVSKAMNPPKKRAMAPLKKRLVARAAIDEAAMHAQLALAAEKEAKPVAKKTGTKAPAAKTKEKKGKKAADVLSSSSNPSSPDTPKGKKREKLDKLPVVAPVRSEKNLPPKKRNLQALQLCKPTPAKSSKKPERRESTSDSSDDEKPALDVFQFWAEPKKQHRVASLNALAKVHCMYENEASRPLIESSQMTTTTTTRSISTRTTKSSQWYDSSSESSSSGSESSPGAMVPYRKGAKPPKKAAKKSKPKKVEPEEDDDEYSPPSPPPKTKRKKKKCDVLMDLKDMVVRKRMASLNASAILAASYSFEKRSPNKNCTTTVEVVEVKQQTSTSIDKKPDGDTVSTSSINTVRMRKNKMLADARKKAKAKPDKKRKKKEESTTDDASADDPDDDIPLANVIKLRNPKKVALIVNDTDVTITGVYVNSRTTEGYCISGMEYRISSTQTKSTTVVQPPSSQVATSSPVAGDYQHHHLHHHHHHHNPAAGAEQVSDEVCENKSYLCYECCHSIFANLFYLGWNLCLSIPNLFICPSTGFFTTCFYNLMVLLLSANNSTKSILYFHS